MILFQNKTFLPPIFLFQNKNGGSHLMLQRKKHKEHQIPVVIVCRYCKRNRGDIATESEAAWLKVRRAVEGLPLKEDEAKEVSPYQTREKTEREREREREGERERQNEGERERARERYQDLLYALRRSRMRLNLGAMVAPPTCSSKPRGRKAMS